MSSLERIVAPDVADARGLRTEALPQGSGAIITSAELSRRLDDPELTIVDVRPLPASTAGAPTELRVVVISRPPRKTFPPTTRLRRKRVNASS